MVLLNFVHEQNSTNYSHLLAAQVAQAKVIKERYPSTPVFVYGPPIVDAQPYYDSEALIFGGSEGPVDGFTPGEYRDFTFYGDDGKLYPPTTSYKCDALWPDFKKYPFCICAQWNFWNRTAREFFMHGPVTSLASVDQGNSSPSFDGIFFDAASAWIRDVATRAGAANPSLPHPQPTQAVIDIQIELLKNTTAISNRFGKVAMFNMHDGDMNIQNGLEQEIMNGVGGGAGTLMYRFYEQATMLTRDWIENALAERTIHLHTLVVLGAGNLVGPALQHFWAKLPAEIAVFNLIRGPHYYMGAHTHYLDNGWTWHDAYNLDYGRPLGEPVRVNQSGGGVLYSRSYTACEVHVLCATPRACNGWVNFTKHNSGGNNASTASTVDSV